MRCTLLFLALAACAADPATTDTASADGQTGQTGTWSGCQDATHVYETYADYDAVTWLGFSAREAVASLGPATGTLTWSDGTATTIELTFTLDEVGEPLVEVQNSLAIEDCPPALKVRTRVDVSTGDGKIDGGFATNEDVEIWALGGAHLTASPAPAHLDLDAMGAPEDATVYFVADVDGPATTNGKIEYVVHTETATDPDQVQVSHEVATW